MKLNVYKNQKEIEKTYEVDNYDIMYGTVQDILSILDEVDDLSDNQKLFDLVKKNRTKLEDLLLDIFGGEGMTAEEMRRTKLKEFIPVFMDLFRYVKESFQSKN